LTPFQNNIKEGKKQIVFLGDLGKGEMPRVGVFIGNKKYLDFLGFIRYS